MRVREESAAWSQKLGAVLSASTTPGLREETFFQDTLNRLQRMKDTRRSLRSRLEMAATGVSSASLAMCINQNSASQPGSILNHHKLCSVGLRGSHYLAMTRASA